MSMKRVCLDMDGVVTNFSAGFGSLVKAVARRMYGKKVVEGLYLPPNHEIPSWRWQEWLHPDPKVATRLVEKAWSIVFTSRTFWESLPPLATPSELERLRLVHRLWPIVFVTRRDGINPWGQTIRWLHEHGIHEPLVVCVKPGEEKSEVCRRLGLEIAIDDSPQYAIELADQGFAVLMPEYEYNKHVLHPKIMHFSDGLTAMLDFLRMPR